MSTLAAFGGTVRHTAITRGGECTTVDVRTLHVHAVTTSGRVNTNRQGGQSGPAHAAWNDQLRPIMQSADYESAVRSPVQPLIKFARAKASVVAFVLLCPLLGNAQQPE